MTAPHAMAGANGTIQQLHGTPRAHEGSLPGTATVILGILDDGSPFAVSADSLEYFEELEQAARQAWAGGKARGGMIQAVTP